MQPWLKVILCLAILIGAGGLIYIYPILEEEVQQIAFILVCFLLGITLFSALFPNPLQFYEHYQPVQKKRYKGTVLVVDDNIANQRMISNIVSEQDYSVITANDGYVALSSFENVSPQLILMDIEMQGMSGIDTVKKIRAMETEENTRTPVIAISAHNDSNKKLQALAAGYDDYLIKPVDNDLLIDTMNLWLTKAEELNSNTVKNKKETKKTSLSRPTETSEKTNQTTADDAPQTAKVVDIRLSLIHSHNKPELAHEMLTLLIALIREEKDNIKNFFANEDWEPLGHLVHKLSGGCSYCGVPELRELAEKIDKAILNKKYDLVSNEFHLLVAAMDKLLEWDDEHDLAIIFEIEEA